MRAYDRCVNRNRADSGPLAFKDNSSCFLAINPGVKAGEESDPFFVVC